MCSCAYRSTVTIRFFKQLILLQDEFYIKQMVEKQVLGPVLDVLIRTLPRDNLLCSACLDLFETVRNTPMRDLPKHLVETYREKLVGLTFISTFELILHGYDQSQYVNNVETYFIESEDEGTRRPNNVNARGHMEHLAVDPAQEEYWNTSDDDDENNVAKDMDSSPASLPTKPLVDYASDEEADEPGDTTMSPATVEPEKADENKDPSTSPASSTTLSAATPHPERVSEKRRREQNEDDELDKLTFHKRRNSSSSAKSSSSPVSFGSSGGALKKKGFGGSAGSRDPSPHKKRISIIMAPSLKSASAASDHGPSQDENAS